MSEETEIFIFSHPCWIAHFVYWKWGLPLCRLLLSFTVPLSYLMLDSLSTNKTHEWDKAHFEFCLFACLLAISTTSQPPRLKQKLIDKSQESHLSLAFFLDQHPSSLFFFLMCWHPFHMIILFTIYYLGMNEQKKKKTLSPNFILPNTSNLQIQNLLNNCFHWQVSRKFPLCLPIQREKQKLWKVGRVYMLSLSITILFQALQRCRMSLLLLSHTSQVVAIWTILYQLFIWVHGCDKYQTW